MKQTDRRLAVLSVLLLSLGLASAGAEREADERAIRQAVDQFFQTMKTRDADAMRGVLHSSLMCVEAGGAYVLELIGTATARRALLLE